MATITIEVDNVNESTNTAKYTKTGGPGWATVTSTGTINVSSQKDTNLHIQWILVDDGYDFAHPYFTATPDGPFGQPNPTGNNKKVKVKDKNYDNTWHYRLYLVNETGNTVVLHPRIINR